MVEEFNLVNCAGVTTLYCVGFIFTPDLFYPAVISLGISGPQVVASLDPPLKIVTTLAQNGQITATDLLGASVHIVNGTVSCIQNGTQFQTFVPGVSYVNIQAINSNASNYFQISQFFCNGQASGVNMSFNSSAPTDFPSGSFAILLNSYTNVATLMNNGSLYVALGPLNNNSNATVIPIPAIENSFLFQINDTAFVYPTQNSIVITNVKPSLSYNQVTIPLPVSYTPTGNLNDF